MRKQLFWTLLAVCILMAVSAPAQEGVAAVEKAQTGVIRSFWELTRYAREFRWPLFFTFIMGIVLAVKKGVELFFEWIAARRYFRPEFTRLTASQQAAAFARERYSMASDTVLHLLQTLEAAPDAGKFTEEMETFTKTRNQNFSTFRNRMAFWSDTAGALGLLGTVWGMFITFFRGTMEPQEILSGMGIALITTLMGLVISIVINLFSTEIGGFYNCLMERYTAIGHILWRQMVKRQPEHQTGKTAASPSAVKASNNDEAWYRLSAAAGDGQKIMGRGTVKTPLTIRLIGSRKGRKSKLAGEPIRFTCPKGWGKFQNGSETIQVKTDGSGKAEAYFTAGLQLGRCHIEASHPGLPVPPVQFEILIEGVKPASIREVSGNNQSAPAGGSLPEALAVEVLDASGKPLPHCPVQFRVSMGDAQFANQKAAMIIDTDEKGKAMAELVLGPKPGFFSVEAHADGLPSKKVTFKALGQ
ncbi:MAG TPA: hypothetical protein ENN03_02625 [bacterium]|nr:hypothetical protein [bacterium]